MKVELILNGSIKILLTPETETEKLILTDISKYPLDAQKINKHTQVLDRVVQEGLVITTKSENNGS